MNNNQNTISPDPNFYDRIEEYKKGIKEIRRSLIATLLFSVISLLDVYDYFHLDGNKVFTLWGSTLGSFMEEKRSIVLFGITSGMTFYYFFFFAKIWIKSRAHSGIWSIFLQPWPERHFHGEFSQGERPEDETRRDTGLFIFRYWLFGFVEYLFIPAILPLALGVWALSMLVMKAFFS